MHTRLLFSTNRNNIYYKYIYVTIVLKDTNVVKIMIKCIQEYIPIILPRAPSKDSIHQFTD